MDDRKRGVGVALLVAFLVLAPMMPSVSGAVTWPPDAETCGGGNLEGLLYYAERVRVLAPPALDRELEERKKFERAGSCADEQIRLALLLSRRGAPFRDDEKARQLLAQAATETDAGPRQALASLLLHQLGERRALEAALAEERRERALLRRQLDQLKALEEQIPERLPPVIPR